MDCNGNVCSTGDKLCSSSDKSRGFFEYGVTGTWNRESGTWNLEDVNSQEAAEVGESGFFTIRTPRHEEPRYSPQQRESTRAKRPRARKIKKLPGVYHLSAKFR